MIRLSLSLGLALVSAAVAEPAITNLVLNPREVVVVPVATDRLTMIAFPSAIAQVEGAYLATDEEPPARFQVSFKPGNSFLSVRALLPTAAASLTVVWNRQIFVFDLVASSQSWRAVNLVEPIAGEVRLLERTPSAHRLLGILDTAKAYELLRTQQPQEVANVVRVLRTNRWDYGTYELRLEEIFKFQPEDTLVFRLVFHNQSGTPLTYQPQSFHVAVGQCRFYAAIADGDGTIPARGTAPVYFAITTAPDGSRPGLALDNDFILLYSTPLPAPTAPPTPAGFINYPLRPK